MAQRSRLGLYLSSERSLCNLLKSSFVFVNSNANILRGNLAIGKHIVRLLRDSNIKIHEGFKGNPYDEVLWQ